MRATWRLLDTGLRTAAENMALDDIILDCRSRDLVPDTLRFLRFSPPAVLIGYHQDAQHEVRFEYVRAHGIDVNRRITGGGAIYFDENTIGWEVIASKDSINSCGGGEGLFEWMCRAPILALRKLGLNAKFRPKNDIEVEGRKISGTGGTERGGAFLFQGTLLTDFDIESMIKSLKIPIVKLKDKEIKSAKQRVTCIKWEIGYTPPYEELKRLLVESFSEVLGVDFKEEGLGEEEQRLLQDRLPYFQSEDWLYLDRRAPEEAGLLRAVDKAEGGLVEVALTIDKRAKVIKSILIIGDFFASPMKGILDLEAALKFTSYEKEELERNVKRVFREKGLEIIGIEPDFIVNLITQAVNKTSLESLGLTLDETNYIHAVNLDSTPLLNQKWGYLLLPYCSKLVNCPYRKEEGCVQCGLCSVGEAYNLGLEAGLTVKTIQSFEHLMDVLKEIKQKGLAYIGCCCEAFFTKHLEELRDAGVPALLLDIDDKTCYELGKEDKAYIGSFEGQTTLKLPILTKILNTLKCRSH